MVLLLFSSRTLPVGRCVALIVPMLMSSGTGWNYPWPRRAIQRKSQDQDSENQAQDWDWAYPSQQERILPMSKERSLVLVAPVIRMGTMAYP